MISLRKTSSAFGLDLVEAPETTRPKAGEVTVEIKAVGICGSDVHAYEWTEGYSFMEPLFPITMGHEFAGQVVDAGPGAALSLGTSVTVMPVISCFECPACRRGDMRSCERKQTIGLTLNGGFARHVTVPEQNCLVLPQGVDIELGALTEPLSVGCDAVLTGEVKLGDTVLVLGPGTIGQAIALMARAAGAGRVLVAGRADAPRFEVLRQLGFDELLDVAAAPLGDLVLAANGGRPVDVVLEATGNPGSVAAGLSVLKRGGIMVVAGIYPAAGSIPLTDFVRSRQQIRASHGSARSTWDRVLALLAREPEAYRPMITHRLPLVRGIEGFELARQRAASKVMLEP